MCPFQSVATNKSPSRTALLGLPTVTVLLLIMQGCASVGPDYQEPVIQTPDAWTEKVAEQVALGPRSTLQAWWTVFDDPLLDTLIERSRKENLDLRVAASRVRESRAILAIARGEKQPSCERQRHAPALPAERRWTARGGCAVVGFRFEESV